MVNRLKKPIMNAFFFFKIESYGGMIEKKIQRFFLSEISIYLSLFLFLDMKDFLMV